jgi:DNA repair protein RadD
VDLRPYQADLLGRVHSEWNRGAQNVLMRLDTGGGKSVLLANLVRDHAGASCVIAHRQELVGQLSVTLARHGVRHNLICAAKTRQAIVAAHMAEVGASFFNPAARCAVASVDTLIRAEGLEGWARQVTLWVCDEGHHLVDKNKWSKAVGAFTHPACRGLLPTATPQRADGKGLGRHADGLADVMVEGPPMRWLIEQGYLTDYDVVCPLSDITAAIETVAAGATGDWSPAQLREAADKSHIVGDVVTEYRRHANGRLGITFCTDVDTAARVTMAYEAAGIPAATLTGETPDGYRRQILRQFAARQILQIVAVDIISEGFDLPAIEVASFARPTQSLALYMQQFGRTLRIMPGKEKALIIDHVGNFMRHGPPDRPRVWTLDRRDKRSSTSGQSLMQVCNMCAHPFEKVLRACPHCGHREQPAAGGGRVGPEMVCGDLAMLDGETLAQLRGAVQEATMSETDYQAHLIAVRAPYYGKHMAQHKERLAALATLRDAMELWVGGRIRQGDTDYQVHRRFWLTFGLDVLSANALGRADAVALTGRILETL